MFVRSLHLKRASDEFIRQIIKYLPVPVSYVTRNISVKLTRRFDKFLGIQLFHYVGSYFVSERKIRSFGPTPFAC
ncbi:hypothetical protein AVEN_234543-1 [Araneus ventricosus]|uniref:Uncharacterized protein n=1 Tax=Araneus ventricosus TaxID=182803 RepID=A0A4Y2AAG7_ARAVE|nr:hypothetical protein AVEN_234543-1 [Araneus ventricosus]